MSNRLLDFLDLAMQLKTLKRAGWQRCGVEPCESVADHSFGVALLALVTPSPQAPSPIIDRNRCIAMALVHDLAESIVGDLTPHDPIGPAEKHRREEQAMEQLAATLGDRTIIDLWHEFESGKTEEARLVRDLDVIEMARQVRAYQQAGQLPPERANEFVESARRHVQTDVGRKLLEQIAVRSG